MCKKVLCALLALGMVLTGCSVPGSTTSSRPADPTSSTVESNTPTWEPDIPTQRTIRSSSDSAYIVRMDHSWLMAEETDGVSSYYVVEEGNEDPTLFFSTPGRNLGFHKIDDTIFVLSWYTSDVGNHYRMYAMEDLQTPIEIPLGPETIRYQFQDRVLYYTTEQTENPLFPYALYRLEENGQPERILETTGWEFALVGNAIYYYRDNSVYAMDLSGTHHVKVYNPPRHDESEAFRFAIMDHWIVFSYEWENPLGYMYNMHSGETVPLNFPVYAEDYVSDKEYYYLSGPEGIYRVNAETMEVEVMADLAAGGLSVYEGNLYFHSLRSTTGSLPSNPIEQVYRIDVASKEMTILY